MIDQELLDRAVAFHGHLCPGLLIGVRAALIAKKALGIKPSRDEEIVAIVENRSCGIDALQILLGATAGKGNLYFKDHGKQVVTVGSRRSKKAFRISLKAQPEMSREAKTKALMSRPDDELFDVREVEIAFPPKAAIFHSVSCDACGEPTMETALKLLDGRKLCQPCFNEALEKRSSS